MTHSRALVLANERIAADYYELKFAWPDGAETPRPGQFFTVRAGDTPVPLLRRPFAVSAYAPARREAATIYQKRGAATSLMSALRTGDRIDLLAPLGNTFPDPDPDRVPVLVAGGVGMGPVFFFAETLCGRFPALELVLGARTRGYLPEMEVLATVNATLCTDDGSKGFRGTVVDYLAGALPPNAELFACGPDPMLKALHRLAVERDVPCWVSMEQTMGCAVGACMGCAIRVPDDRKYVRVCTEGPVFASRELRWE